MVTKDSKKKAPAKKAPARAKSAKTKKAPQKRASRSKAGAPVQESQQVLSAVVGKATLRHIRISPQKARLVIDQIRGKQVEPALNYLRFSNKKGAALALKALESAVMNAKEFRGADVDKLWVIAAYVDMGRTLKRYMPRAQGRATPIRKRCSHITVCLGER